MRVPDDLHQMVDYIPDLQNMMMIGLDFFTIIGILILTIGLAILTIIGILILITGLPLLTIIKILIFLFLKRRNGEQERRGPQTPSPIPSESAKSEQNHPRTLIMNDDHTCIPLLDIPMPTTPTSMLYYSDSTAAAYGAVPLTTSVSVAATPSVSSLINSENPSMIKARVFDGNLNEVCVSRETQTSREMLCNENSSILCDSTDAHEMSKDYCNGEIVDEEKQTYTYDKKPIFPTTTTSTKSGGFNGLNKNINNTTVRNKGRDVKLVRDITNARDINLGTSKQTTFIQHTTNFIVCFSDPLKPFV